MVWVITDATIAANSQELIDGLQLGRDLDEILAKSVPVSDQDEDEDDDDEFRKNEWDLFRSWVNIITGQVAEIFQFGIYYVRCQVCTFSCQILHYTAN